MNHELIRLVKKAFDNKLITTLTDIKEDINTAEQFHDHKNYWLRSPGSSHIDYYRFIVFDDNRRNAIICSFKGPYDQGRQSRKKLEAREQWKTLTSGGSVTFLTAQQKELSGQMHFIWLVLLPQR